MAHLLVREKIALQQRVLATVHRVYETAFLVEIPRHNLLHQFARIAALLSGGSRKFRFEFGCEKYFHNAQK